MYKHFAFILLTILLATSNRALAAGETADAASEVTAAASAPADAASDNTASTAESITAAPGDAASDQPVTATQTAANSYKTPAITFNAGHQILGAALGVTFPTKLSPARSMMDIRLEYQYFLPQSLSLAAGLGFMTSFAKTSELIGSIGARYHLAKFAMPLTMVFGIDFAGGGLFNVRNANLGYVGGRLLIGVNYFIREKISAGASIIADIGSSVSERPAAYSTIGLVLNFNYHLF